MITWTYIIINMELFTDFLEKYMILKVSYAGATNFHDHFAEAVIGKEFSNKNDA